MNLSLDNIWGQQLELFPDNPIPFNGKLLHIQISLLNHRLTTCLLVYLDVKSIDQNYCHAPMLIVTSATAATAAAAVAAGDVDIVVVHLCFIIVGRIPMGHFTWRDA